MVQLSMFDKILGLRARWPLKRKPLVEAPKPVVKTGLPTGSTEEQTRFTSEKQAAALVYNESGRLVKAPKLDEPP